MLGVALSLELEHELLYRHTPTTHATKALAQSVRHTLQSILYEGLSLWVANVRLTRWINMM